MSVSQATISRNKQVLEKDIEEKQASFNYCKGTLTQKMMKKFGFLKQRNQEKKKN